MDSNDTKRLAFYHPSEVRLWQRASGYKVDAMPANKGDEVIIRNFGERVGVLVLEEESPTQLVAVAYFDEEKGGGRRERRRSRIT